MVPVEGVNASSGTLAANTTKNAVAGSLQHSTFGLQFASPAICNRSTCCSAEPNITRHHTTNSPMTHAPFAPSTTISYGESPESLHSGCTISNPNQAPTAHSATPTSKHLHHLNDRLLPDPSLNHAQSTSPTTISAIEITVKLRTDRTIDCARPNPTSPHAPQYATSARKLVLRPDSCRPTDPTFDRAPTNPPFSIHTTVHKIRPNTPSRPYNRKPPFNLQTTTHHLSLHTQLHTRPSRRSPTPTFSPYNH